MSRLSVLTLWFCLLPGVALAQNAREKMPREDVVHVPAIGDGLCVSNVFQTNMVLQRDKPLKIWGWAKPDAEVTVAFATQVVTAKAAADRSWQAVLAPLAAESKPQSITVKSGAETLTLENILVGDVWVLGGQSNMEFPIVSVDDGELEIVSANFPQIRLLTLPQGKGFDSVHSFERLHEWSDWSSRHFQKGEWEICSPTTVKEFSAIGYVFGRRLHMATRVPIGLIDSSIGGTTVETWTPQATLAKIEGQETRDLLKDWADKIAAFDPQADLQTRIANYQKRLESLKAKGEKPPAEGPPSDLRPGPAGDRNRPGYCYASVIRPLEGLAVKGAVFHQGFNNCFNGSAGARMYYQVFGQMIAAWRAAFDNPQMPFCIISLPTAGDPQTPENFAESMYDVGVLIREAQYKTFVDLHAAGDKNIGFVSSFDLQKSWYHPQIKIPAGERVAKWACATQYDLLKGREAQDYWLPPTIKKTEVVEGTIRLTMSTPMKTKDDRDGKLVGFAIAGADRRYYPADVEWLAAGKDKNNRPIVQRDVLVLSSRFVPTPVHFRYAWARNPYANIVGAQGAVLPAQRSDNWDLDEMPDGPATDPKQARNLTVQALKRLDMERRVQEAEATIAELKATLEKGKSASRK